MRRALTRRLLATVTAVLLAGPACDGGGVREGIPKDLTPAASLDSLKSDTKARNAPSGGSRRGGLKTAVAPRKN